MKGYGELLESDLEWAERARDFATRVRDVSELLSAAGPREGAPVETRAAYDAPCHLLHGQGVSSEVHDVLGAIPGLEVVVPPDADRCCGGAGIYGVTHPELGGTITGAKIEAVSGTGAEVVCTGNVGCMMQIGGGLLLAGVEMGVVHPVELLDESYRRAGIYEQGAAGSRAGHAGDDRPDLG
jgi:glycolate oxidase iron-sulfur subunit